MQTFQDAASTFVTCAYKAILQKEIFIAIAVSVLLIAGSVFLGSENNKVVPVSTNAIAHYTAEPHNRLSFLADWDGPDYLLIATRGYTASSETNFFPLYPLAIRIVNYIVPSPLDSALLISWVCLIGVVYFFIKIVKRLSNVTDNGEGLRAALLFLLFPTGVFLLAAYTESMFALFALGSIYFALQKKYLAAGLMAMLATATHVNGAFVVVLIAMLLWEQKERLRNIIIAFIIGFLGLASYMLYLTIKFHKPLDFITAQQKHGWLQHSVQNPGTGIGWLNVVFIVLLIISVIYWWQRRKSLAVYSLLFLCIPAIGGQFGGFNRYVLMAFPIPLMFYDKFKHDKVAYSICLSVSVVLWAYFLFQYTGGYVGG